MTDWRILFSFKQLGKEWRHDFYNVSHLANYFQSVPEQAILVGYGKEMPLHRRGQTILPCSDAMLMLWFLEYEKAYHYGFLNVYDFANFLKQEPTVAKAVGYKPS